jgi:outer membrane lipoprotein-sorting protein
MGANGPARSGLIMLAPVARCFASALIASMIATAAGAETSVVENVPLPVPAPLPKTGVAPPPAAPAKPAAETKQSPGLFPFSALFGNKSSPSNSTGTTAPETPSPFSALFGNKSSNGSSGSAAPDSSSPFDAKQRALLDRISAYLSSVQTMVGKFVQVGPDGGRTEGTFYIQKPGRVRFEYNPPSPIDIIADGFSVVVRDRKLATQDLYPLSQTPLRYLLADHIDLLRDTDVVSVSSDDSFITVVIEQKQLLVGTNRLMIMFDAKDSTLKQWTVTDPQGFDTTVAVYNLDSTKKPDPNLFVINYQRDQGGIQ